MIHNKQHLDQFLRAARFRSEQNKAALDLLLKAHIYAIAIGLLRQEIDTFVRLVYLQSVDAPLANELIAQFVRGERWSRKKKLITDGEMVELAQAKHFWVEKAYRFGCKLIHLSDFHDYQSVDPFTTIPTSDKRTIMNFLRDYHGYRENDIDLPRFIELLPKVMVKIRGKVEKYCDALERR